jgi:putative transposase
MKKMTEDQIVAILKEAEAGIPVKELCRKYGMGNSTFYKWRENTAESKLRISNT